MFVVTGASGQTGRATAEALLEQKQPVTAVVRSQAKAEAWKLRGAQTAILDLADAAALTSVLKGKTGAYLVVPPNYGAADYVKDRQAIVDKLWRGRGVVPNDAYPNVDKIGYDKHKLPFEFDPKKARELLAQAGYKGEEIVIESAVGYLANDKQLTETLGAMFQEVGIKAKVQLIEYSVRAQKLRQKAIDGLLLGDPTSTLLDPDGMFWRLMQPGGLIDYWRHAEWDRLMGEARFLQDPHKRDALYKQAAKIFLEEVPVLIVLQPEKTFALKKDLNWKARSDEIVVVYDIKPAP